MSLFSSAVCECICVYVCRWPTDWLDLRFSSARALQPWFKDCGLTSHAPNLTSKPSVLSPALNPQLHSDHLRHCRPAWINFNYLRHHPKLHQRHFRDYHHWREPRIQLHIILSDTFIQRLVPATHSLVLSKAAVLSKYVFVYVFWLFYPFQPISLPRVSNLEADHLISDLDAPVVDFLISNNSRADLICLADRSTSLSLSFRNLSVRILFSVGCTLCIRFGCCFFSWKNQNTRPQFADEGEAGFWNLSAVFLCKHKWPPFLSSFLSLWMTW